MHILLLAYRFPPQGGVGAIRPAKFAKYLRREGARISVIAGSAESDAADPSLLEDLPPDIRVVRVREDGLRGWLAARLASAPTGLRGRAWIAARYLYYQSIVPDEHAGFIRPACRAALQMPRPDLVLATGRPWSCLVAGAKIARRFGVPLVLDYRDPWTASPSGWFRQGGARARSGGRRMERSIARQAEGIVTAHEELPRFLEEQLRLPGLQRRSIWIPNGYDPEDFDRIEPAGTRANGGETERGDDGRFVLTYTGALYGGRSLAPLVRGIQALVSDGALDPRRTLLRIVGPRDRAAVSQQAAGVPIEQTGMIPYYESLRYLTRSTVNLLVGFGGMDSRFHTPVKLYEYLRAGRSVLAIGGEGAAADLVREARAGWVVAEEDPTGLRRALQEAANAWRQGALPRPDPSVASRFDRSRTVSGLARYLERVAAGPAPAGLSHRSQSVPA